MPPEQENSNIPQAESPKGRFSKKGILISIIIIVVVLAGGYVVLSKKGVVPAVGGERIGFTISYPTGWTAYPITITEERKEFSAGQHLVPNNALNGMTAEQISSQFRLGTSSLQSHLFSIWAMKTTLDTPLTSALFNQQVEQSFANELAPTQGTITVLKKTADSEFSTTFYYHDEKNKIKGVYHMELPKPQELEDVVTFIMHYRATEADYNEIVGNKIIGSVELVQ